MRNLERPTDGLVTGFRVTTHFTFDHRDDVLAMATRVFIENRTQVVHVASGDYPQEDALVRSPPPESKETLAKQIIFTKNLNKTS